MTLLNIKRMKIALAILWVVIWLISLYILHYLWVTKQTEGLVLFIGVFLVGTYNTVHYIRETIPKRQKDF